MKQNSNKVTKKEQLRAWAKSVRANIALNKLNQINKEIVSKIRSNGFYKNASTVMSYLATGTEVNLEMLFEDDKKWYLPVVKNLEDNKLLIAPYFHGKSKLVQGKFNIREPEIEASYCFDQVNKKIHLDLIIVPGLCFDRLGNRLGYGKGYYDDFLKLNHNSFKIGICPKECLIQSIPVDEWDVKVDMVISS